MEHPSFELVDNKGYKEEYTNRLHAIEAAHKIAAETGAPVKIYAVKRVESRRFHEEVKPK